MNDYDKVLRYKREHYNNEVQAEIIETVINNYKPLYISMSKKYISSIKQYDRSYTIEDIIMEYYILTYRCLDYIDVKKIKNKEAFIIGSYLKRFLKVYSQSWYRNSKSHYSKINSFAKSSMYKKYSRDSNYDVAREKELWQMVNDLVKTYPDKSKERIVLESLINKESLNVIKDKINLKNTSGVYYYIGLVRKDVEKLLT